MGILAKYILNGRYDKTINIEVTFEIDANGILTVTTIDDINGKNEIIITADQGRPSQEEIDRMLRDAEKYEEEDKKYEQGDEFEEVADETLDDYIDHEDL